MMCSEMCVIRQVDVLSERQTQHVLVAWQSKAESSGVVCELFAQRELERILDLGIDKRHFVRLLL